MWLCGFAQYFEADVNLHILKPFHIHVYAITFDTREHTSLFAAVTVLQNQ